jgi:SAM-dependent methyltransferase
MQIAEDFSRRSKIVDLGRFWVTRFVRDAAAALPPGSTVLDAGAGECVYKPFFAHCEYQSVDLAVGEERWNYAHLDYVAPLDALPMADGTYDAVLCTQVLEHVPNPGDCLRELQRVLKTGGRLFLTVPMAHPEHQAPHDYYRYTSFGLRYLLDHAGFATFERLDPMGGMFTRWAYELPRAMAIFPGSGLKQGPVCWQGIAILPLRFTVLGLVRLSQRLLLALERFDRRKDDPFGWQVVARKGERI